MVCADSSKIWSSASSKCGGNVHAPDKLLSVFEPTTEMIRKGKAGKPNELGKMVKIQEAENQIVTSYEVYEQRPDDRAILLDAVSEHERRLGRRPRLVAADAGFSSAANERALEQHGVEQISIPNYATRDPARRGRQKQRWFKRGQKWRTGCEGRISVLKRRHGLGRSRYPGLDGMRRWVGLGVIADNPINIGACLETRATVERDGGRRAGGEAGSKRRLAPQLALKPALAALPKRPFCAGK